MEVRNIRRVGAPTENDDVHPARKELEEGGIEIVGDPGRDSRWEWIHVRAPDGNLDELASCRPDAA